MRATTRSTADSLPRYESGPAAALAMRPDYPVYCFRPEVLKADTRRFLAAFDGKTAYAVKTNGEPIVLDTLVEAGVTAFDVASPAEFADARAALPSCELLYMHPVKAQSDIRLGLETFGIRTLSLDHEDEVAKILRVVRGMDASPEDFTLFVRIATKGEAAYELSKKFGASPLQAVELIDRIANIGFKIGLCFHVGSQIEDIDTYERALASAAWVRGRVDAEIAALDIGGGFPAPYAIDPKKPDRRPPEMEALLAEIQQEKEAWGLGDLPAVAEPGRVIVARAFSVLVRVLLRKGQRIYINDGIWGSLSDAWTGKLNLPVRHIPDPARPKRRNAPAVPKIEPFRVCGATCDSVDILSTPFHLPETIDTGDWIEVGHVGAYSLALRTRFNGFYPETMVVVDEPFAAG